MASFGSFEAGREVYSDPGYTVYSAHRQGDPVTEYALKVFRFPVSELEAELAGQTLSREELEQTRFKSLVVQETAGAASHFIAPILEKGKNDQGVWYATRSYPRSVNRMMSGKVALPRASLEHIIRSIAQGALDLKRACGRSHGDIPPTNIQVSKCEKLTDAEVVLCDPLPGGNDEARRYETNDLHAVGMILLQLVRQRMLTNDDVALMLPIGPSPEWARIFGNDASDWLALCNRLLDPKLSPDHFKLDDLVTRLDELTPKRKGPPRMVVACAVVVIIAIALGLWLMRPQPGTVEISSDPTGATILVDQSKPCGVTPLRLKLSRGDHVIEARHDQLGLFEEATNCVVESGKSAQVHFQFPYGTVTIKSDPPGATVLRDGLELGRIPMDGQPLVLSPVAPGVVRYQLSLEPYEPAVAMGMVSNLQKLELAATLRRSQPEKSTTLAPAATTTTQPALPASNGVLELKSEPVTASIVDSDGRIVGRASPDTLLVLTRAPGTYSLAAQADGLDVVPVILTVESLKTNQHTFVFDYGLVEWRSEPVPAAVSLGTQTRVTPATFVQKPGVATSYVIAAPGYQFLTNDVIVKSGERKSMVARLIPQTLSVELVSDPPGAEFFAENGSSLARNETNKQIYYVPLGPTNLVARYPALGTITNHFDLKPDQNGARAQFNFDYGTLILTNLPPDLAVYEGQTRIGSAVDQWVYQKRGAHLYALRGQASSEAVQTNINSGLNFLWVVTAEKSWKNSLGMWFAWVPNLPGGGPWPGQSEPGGWVALTEVTQGIYKKMDGSNPSAYREGGDNYPVENLTCEQAVRFCRWLSSADTAARLGWQYSLPTDQQFSAFAADADRLARVTNESRMSSTSDDLFPLQRIAKIPAAANFNNSARLRPEPVASTKQPNQFGLYDVVGNVWEWLARSNGKGNFYAGGGYLNFSPRTVTAKARERALEKGPAVGFRVILVPSQ
jgi:sulfatase-modifying factor enzyme 1